MCSCVSVGVACWGGRGAGGLRCYLGFYHSVLFRCYVAPQGETPGSDISDVAVPYYVIFFVMAGMQILNVYWFGKVRVAEGGNDAFLRPGSRKMRRLLGLSSAALSFTLQITRNILKSIGVIKSRGDAASEAPKEKGKAN
jgi:hypothetical protein